MVENHPVKAIRPVEHGGLQAIKNPPPGGLTLADIIRLFLADTRAHPDRNRETSWSSCPSTSEPVFSTLDSGSRKTFGEEAIGKLSLAECGRDGSGKSREPSQIGSRGSGLLQKEPGARFCPKIGFLVVTHCFRYYLSVFYGEFEVRFPFFFEIQTWLGKARAILRN